MKTALSALATCLPLFVVATGFAADGPGPSRATDLLPPTRMTAAGKPIIADGRCAALTMGDFNNDGKSDLLVGQMTEGRLRIYLNIGTRAQPKFGEGNDFMAGDERACVPSGCYTGFNPQLVDFDGDGQTDLLSPSFNSGIYLFRRAENGSFAQMEMLDDRHGQPIKFRYNGAALAYDWDADGDLDLLVRGGLAGVRSGVNLIINEGRPGNPIYGEIRLLRADGRKISGKPCCVVDWDGDGKDDLLTCAGNASWYRNTGDKGKPVLQAAEILVPSGRYHQVKRSSEAPRQMPDQPGRIDSVCAGDVNGDGRLDLLAASTWCDKVELPEPTEKHKAIRKGLQTQASALSKKHRELSKPIENESREARTRRQRDSLRAWSAYAAHRAELMEFVGRHDYSCVWLFERTAAGN